jgi:ABC-2 type transport system permease protein
MNLVKAELRKLRTTNTWWIFTALLVPLWALAVLVNWGNSKSSLTTTAADRGLTGQQAEQFRVSVEAVNIGATMYTSGQFLGVLLVLLLGAIIVTNEFFHLTATTTFLITPARERVIVAKLVAGALLGILFWLLTTVLNLIVVPFLMDEMNIGSQLGEPAIWRAIALNALAFVLWSVVGVGAGVLIRSQLGATLTLSIAYLIGTIGAGLVFFLLGQYVGEWTSKLQVIVPTAASQLMISGTELPGNPPRWVGAAVLIGYALVTGVLGTMLMKRRDIS